MILGYPLYGVIRTSKSVCGWLSAMLGVGWKVELNLMWSEAIIDWHV